MNLALLKTVFSGFLKNLALEEVAVPLDKMSAEFSALQQLLAKNGQELRRVREGNSGFTGYYVARVGEPMLLPGLKK